MDPRRARKLLGHAVSLHVLTGDDLAQAGGGGDPVATLIELQRRSLLGPEVVEALEQLVQAHGRRDAASSIRGVTLAPERRESAAQESDTLAPERSPDEEALLSVTDPVTLAPERDDEADLATDFLAASSFMDALESETLAPERASGESVGVAESASSGVGTLAGDDGGTLAGDDGGTLAGDDGGTLAGHDGGTLAGEGLLSDDLVIGTLAGDEAPAGVPGASLDLSSGELKRDAPPPAQVVARGTLDLALVSERVQRQIQEAAFLRAAIERGVDRRQAQLAQRAARERRVLLQEHLIQEGLIDRAQAQEIQATVQATAAVCHACFAVLPPDHELGGACPACDAGGSLDTGAGTTGGDTTGGGTTGGDTTGGGTLVSSSTTSASGTGSTRGIEGFPGEGGRFASYELIHRVAEGGMGVVFKARELNLNRIVALKVMRGGALASKMRRRRFLTEAEAAAALHHPNIVPIHQISEVSGYPFYTMDYVEGAVLDDYVRDHEVDQQEVARLVRTVADAVHHFHLRGIIHRDLKPDNILVNEQAEPRIIDFGIAKKITSEYDTEAGWTVEGEVLGTPHYMPPEQAGGRVHEVDTRSDVYALGAIMYELLTGRPPFYGLPTARVVLAIQDEDPRPLTAARPDVDKDLEAIVGKAMAKERERRYQSALELAQDLERFIQNEPILARPASLGYRLSKLVRRHRAAVIASSVVTVALVAALGYGAWKAGEDGRKIAGLIARAQDSADLERRRALLDQALGIDPAHNLAKSQKAAVSLELQRQADLEEARRQREEAIRLERERAKQQELESQLAKERAERQIKQFEAAERAREEAAQAQQRLREGQAQALLDRASAAGVEKLQAISFLTDALALVPEESGELGARLATAKASLGTDLAEEALAQARAGMAEYWLGQTHKLAAAATQRERLETISRGIFALLSGNELYQEAKLAIGQQDWLLARDKLRQARERGLDTQDVLADAALVDARCVAEADRLLDAARAALGDGHPEQGIALTRQAAPYLDPSEQAALHDVAREAARQAFNATRSRVHQLWQRPETRPEALEQLRALAPMVKGTRFEDLVAAERRHRQRVVDERSLAGLVYLPALPELELEAVYVMRAEVTNEEYKRFVDAGGYRDHELWDPPALPLLDRMRDQTPGEAKQPGPRTWVHGSYGDPANASRPVCGITYYEARAYARWRCQQTGGSWRLPTTQEWELAAGWDPATRRLQTYPWGDAFRPDAMSLDRALPDPVATTTADQSPLGARDMAGNVSEWVEDPQPGGGVAPALKGSFFAAGAAQGQRLAKVQNTGHPQAVPPRELAVSIGFRLVLQADEP